ncbi:MAG: DNA primase [Ruminococcus sp.]|nr:DNA primase [Ruminococcus sp.]
MNVFEQVKEAVDMRTVAEGYGLNIDRSGMCLCPFHAEKTSSTKVYPHNIYCFGCGASADVIGFTQRLFSLSEPIEAVKKLNDDYDLHFAVGQAPTSAEVSEYHKRIAERRAYVEWEKQAWRTLHDYLWLMREWRELVPKSPDDVQDRRFVYALHHLDYAEYLCDEFLHVGRSGKLAMGDTIRNIENIIRMKG